MAAVLTGTPVAITWAAGADPAGQSVTVPADATALAMFWSLYRNASANSLSTATYNGVSADRIVQVPGVNGGVTATGVAIWDNPATGAHTLDLAWLGAPVEGSTCIAAFVKDGDVAANWVIDMAQGTATGAVSVTLATVTGELVLKYNQEFGSVPDETAGWTTAQTHGNNSEFANLAYRSAAGTSTVCPAEPVTNYSTIVAISIPPGAGGGGTPYPPVLARRAKIITREAA